MFEKNLEINYLLDFYGEVLSDRKRTVLEMYYNDDLSLAEIALDIGISRQGVRDMIRNPRKSLFIWRKSWDSSKSSALYRKKQTTYSTLWRIPVSPPTCGIRSRNSPRPFGQPSEKEEQ